jgi:Fe-S cluster assembly protein SufB
MKNNLASQKEYQYGFSDANTSFISFKKGLSIDVIKRISKLKNEPK